MRRLPKFKVSVTPEDNGGLDIVPPLSPLAVGPDGLSLFKIETEIQRSKSALSKTLKCIEMTNVEIPGRNRGDRDVWLHSADADLRGRQSIGDRLAFARRCAA